MFVFYFKDRDYFRKNHHIDSVSGNTHMRLLWYPALVDKVGKFRHLNFHGHISFGICNGCNDRLFSSMRLFERL
jgi:hypothetical protein